MPAGWMISRAPDLVPSDVCQTGHEGWNLRPAPLMQRKFKRATLSSLAARSCLALFQAHLLFATDWPQWRGPNRDAYWTESGIVETLPKTGLKVLWRAPIGLGISTPVIVADKVYISDTVVQKPIAHQRVHCLGADLGDRQWTYDYEMSPPDWFFSEEQARGPGATPIVKDGKLYALDLFGGLVCLDTAQGKVIWKKDLSIEYKTKGTSLDASPLIEKDLLVLMLGGAAETAGAVGAGIVAFDRNSGREVWRILDEAVTWSSPIVIDAGGVRQLIVWTQQSVCSLNPTNGWIYWRKQTRTGGSPGTAAVSTPVYKDGNLLISGWMFRLYGERPTFRVGWAAREGVSGRILSDTSSPVIQGDFVYSAKSGGEFLCLNAVTGEEVWRTNTVTQLGSAASVHVTTHGDSAYLFNDRGELIQAHLAPRGYEEVSRTKLIEPTSPFGGRKFAWAAPAFARKNVYVRNDQELFCVSLAESSYPAGKLGK